MMFGKKLLLLLLLLLAGAGPGWAESGPDGAGEPLPLDELRAFSEVFAKIKNDYVEVIDDRTLLENAIRGMLAGLDPHSAYLDQAAYQFLQEGTTGEFGGLGIEIGMEDGFIRVIAPIDDTPAARAGVKAGDVIIRLDDKPVKGMLFNDAVKLMRGKPGSEIVLTILRASEEAPLELRITRAVITDQSVRGEMLEPGFGYVRISSFQSHTAEDLRQMLETLKTENESRLQGLILDLRNNPGGILNAAVGVSDLFLDSGLIVYTEGRVNDAKLKFSAKPSDMLRNAPIIVLVNAGSASASEIVAGALQDHDRAIIMGESTFGKGSVQTILPMANEVALKLTTARYFTPSGRSIQAAGIEPDIIIENFRVDGVAGASIGQIKEADLSGHLDDGRDDADAKQAGGKDPAESAEPSLAETDYQLYEALNVLKGLAIHLKKTG